MLFASFDFLLFFCLAFAGYWALLENKTVRAVWVLAASYFFYVAGPKPLAGPPPTPWYFVGLLVLSTLVDYVCGLRIAAARADPSAKADPRSIVAGGGVTRPKPPGTGRLWLVVSLLANLGLLGYFKYTGFLLQVISDTASLFGTGAAVPALKLILPVGISFYTFQSLSYTIDVYRGRLQAERSFLKFAVFVAFFPQLVAGPIVRASDFLPQLARRPTLTRADVDVATWRIAKGLVKKMLLADFIAASFADRVFASPAEHSSLENLLALYAFTLQIYADFSGYSDIAIGTARLLGFQIPENFNYPYRAVDVADFWRRWHMTLSTWLRDYVYYPLGGSRTGATRTYVNLWVTMFLVGMWHGASWNFVIYATLQACAMVYNRFCIRAAGSRSARLVRVSAGSVGVALASTLLGAVGLKMADPWAFGLVAGSVALFVGLLPKVENWPALRPVHVVLTLHFSVLSRVFFRANTLGSAQVMTKKLFEWDGLGVRNGLFGNEALELWLKHMPNLSFAGPIAQWIVLWVMVAGFAAHYLPSRVELSVERWLPRMPAVVVGAGFAVLLAMLRLALAGPRANIYFAF